MYPTSGATIRADINIKVEEAAAADQFFIAPRVLPFMPVATKSGQYPKIDIAGGELLKAHMTLRSQGGSYGEVTRRWGTDSYDTQDRGLKEAMDDKVAADLRRFFALEVATAKWLRRNMAIDAEISAAATLFNPTHFGAAVNSSVAYTNANLATIDFPADIIAAVDRVEDNAQMANTIVIPKAVFSRLVLSTKLQNWVRGTLKGNSEMPVNAANIAASFADQGITQVLIGRARYDSGKKGAAKSVAQVWPNTHVWVGYVNPAARTPQDGGAGFTLYWSETGGPYQTDTYRDEDRKSNMLRVSHDVIEKITDGTAGTLIATQFA